DKKARIEIDYWRDGKMETAVASRLDHNLDDDVGLVVMNDDPLPSCRVAPQGSKIMKGSPVVSVGCSGGDNPTVQMLKITALNRYLGADNIEVGGMPVQGRSGGGLFTPDGQVIGVCSGADSHHREGLYVGPKTIRALLDRCSLAHLYRPVGQRGNEQRLADRPAKGDDRLDPSVAEKESGDEIEVADSGKKSRDSDNRSTLRKREPAPPAEAGTDEGAIREALEQAGEAEIVCIIRPINQPRAASRVVILNRASRRFVAYLSDDGDAQPNIQETTLSAKEPPPRQPGETQKVKRPTTGSTPAGTTAHWDEEAPRPTGPKPYKRKRPVRPLVSANGQE
ncbi:MAG: S1 family peptidase, partial [Deltaproteobacteria bacterium]